MKIEDIFLYDLKYGKLKDKMIDGILYSMEETYMGEDMDDIIARLKDSGHISSADKRHAARCNYCGNDTFYIIQYSTPQNKSGNTGALDTQEKKNLNICANCGRSSDSFDKLEDLDGIRLENKGNHAVEILHLFYNEVKNANLNFEIPSKTYKTIYQKESH